MSFYYPKRRESYVPTIRDILSDSFLPSFFGDHATDRMRTDIVEKDDHYELTVEMPGVQKENIKVNYMDNALHVSATFETVKEEKETNGFVYRERQTGNYSRSYAIEDIDAALIKARYENGLLMIHCPKRSLVPPTSQSITIE